jgi:hypothetical protein
LARIGTLATLGHQAMESIVVRLNIGLSLDALGTRGIAVIDVFGGNDRAAPTTASAPTNVIKGEMLLRLLAHLPRSSCCIPLNPNLKSRRPNYWSTGGKGISRIAAKLHLFRVRESST